MRHLHCPWQPKSQRLQLRKRQKEMERIPMGGSAVLQHRWQWVSKQLDLWRLARFRNDLPLQLLQTNHERLTGATAGEGAPPRLEPAAQRQSG